jgi:hypothetical protein
MNKRKKKKTIFPPTGPNSLPLSPSLSPRGPLHSHPRAPRSPAPTLGADMWADSVSGCYRFFFSSVWLTGWVAAVWAHRGGRLPQVRNQDSLGVVMNHRRGSRDPDPSRRPPDLL